jgi:DNA-3-methyladenine glycosylase
MARRSGPPQPLSRSFSCRDAETVARLLLGHYLVRRVGGEVLSVRIVETEAYLGEGDRASHAWRGVARGRARSLFCPGGQAYVYLIYGLHHLFNVVTGSEGDGSAVLVRAGEPVAGLETMARNRGVSLAAPPGAIAGGPGKLSQALGITTEHNGARLDRGDLVLCRGTSVAADSIVYGSRIGVAYAGEAASWPLRFAEAGNPHVSKPRSWHNRG